MTENTTEQPRYEPSDYPPFAVTVDIALMTVVDRELRVLLIQRGEPPYLGEWALPGGFVLPHEDLGQAAARELREETDIRRSQTHMEQLGAYGEPGRDPRMRVVTVAYWAVAPQLREAPQPPAAMSERSEFAFEMGEAALAAQAPEPAAKLRAPLSYMLEQDAPPSVEMRMRDDPTADRRIGAARESALHQGRRQDQRPLEPRGGTDAAHAEMVRLAEIQSGRLTLAFDHRRIVEDAVDTLRARLETTTLAHRFCPPEFTIRQLQEVYEAVWGARLDAGNFYRDILQRKGFLAPAEGRTPSGKRGGRPARLWKAGESPTLDRPYYRSPGRRRPKERGKGGEEQPRDPGGGRADAP